MSDLNADKNKLISMKIESKMPQEGVDVYDNRYHCYIYTGSENGTLALPTTWFQKGSVIKIKNASAYEIAIAIPILTPATKIDGGGMSNILPWQAVTLIFDGTDYYILDWYKP